MEIDIGTFISVLAGLFFLGIAVGEYIERARGKKTYESAYNPIITDYRKQKKDMWKTFKERIK